MSKGLVRFKHNKDIINCVEESWDYYGKEDEMREVIKEIKNVYKIASSAKNAPKTEYEAKAKAFDAVVDIAYWYFERVNPEYADFSDYEGFYEDIRDEFKKYESGELE